MKLRPFKLVPLLIAASVIGLVCLVQTVRPAFFERLEWMSYDWRVRMASNFSPPVATNLGFVYINNESIDDVHSGALGYAYGLYWPRHVYGRLASELAAQNAKAVAFDVIFGELRADHGSIPVTDQSLLATDKLFGRPLDRFGDATLLPSDDFFAWQMKKAGNVIVADTEEVAPHDLFRTNALAVGNIDADKDFDGILRRAKAFKLRWHPVFKAAANQLGIDLEKSRAEYGHILLSKPDGEDTSIPLDRDGNFELADFVGDKIPNGWPRRDKPFERTWHMGIVLAAQELKLDLSKAEVDLEHGRIVLRGTGGVERTIPTDHKGYFYIDWTLRRTDKRLMKQNIVDLLKQDRDRLAGKNLDNTNLWQNKLVVVGSTATGNDLADLGATPLDKETNLMSKHWNIANSVIMGRFIHRSSLSMELLLIVIMGTLVAFLTWGLRSLAAFFWVLALATGYIALSLLLYVNYRYWTPLAFPVVGAMLIHVCLVTYRVMFEQDEKRRIKSVFSRIVSPYVVNELLRTEKLSLDGKRREISVSFTDVRGFTELTDTNREKAAEYVREHNLTGEAAEACFDRQARETLRTVNLYLGTVVDLVIKHNGTLDKYIGDCVMAFWGAPILNKTHALDCVRGAVDAQRAVHELNQKRSVENQRRSQENVTRAAAGQPILPLLPILMVGSGINTGVATVGLMGSDVHGLNYTVFGREINLASRLENISGRGRIIIGEATYRAVSRDDPQLSATFVALPPVTVKGIRNAVKIYEVPWQPANSTLPVGHDKPPAASTNSPGVSPAETTRA